MNPTVFYMNPGATEEICALIRRQMPAGWRLTVPGARADFSDRLGECDFILVANQAVAKEHIAAAPRLRMIQHQGVGYEMIDLNACRLRGIPVALTPEGTSIGVAEHTLLLILAVYKQLLKAATGVNQGRWMQWELRNTSFELFRKNLALVGLGRIGREVAQRALAFGARLIYYDPLVPAPADLNVTRMESLELLFNQADIVSLHLPYTPENRHLINTRTLNWMKPSAILINTARGGLVDEGALAEALNAGKISGAGLDVLSAEPPPAKHPLLSRENVLITPHISAGTQDALVTKMQAAFANLLRFTRGELLRDVVPELADLNRASMPVKM